MRSIATLLLVSAGLLVASPSALAANRKSLERAAKKACLAGDPNKGVEILADLYVDTNDIIYIFNQGRCFEQNRRYDDAIGRFREYLVKGESSLSAEDKALAEKHIKTCESYLPKPEPQALAVAPTPPPVAPIVQPQPVQAPPELPVVQVAQQPQVPGSRFGAGLRGGGIAVVAVGVVGLAAGVALNLKVNSMSADLEKPDNFDRDTDSSRKTYRTIGWVSYGVGAACVVGGSLLYYLGWRSGRDSTGTVALAPNLGPDTVGAVLTGAF